MFKFFISKLVTTFIFFLFLNFSHAQNTINNYELDINDISFFEAIKTIENFYGVKIIIKGHANNIKLSLKSSNSTAVKDIKSILSKINENNLLILDNNKNIHIYFVKNFEQKQNTSISANDKINLSKPILSKKILYTNNMPESEIRDSNDNKPLSFEQIEALKEQNQMYDTNEGPLSSDQILKLNKIYQNIQNVDDEKPLSIDQIKKLNHLYHKDFDEDFLSTEQMEKLRQNYPAEEYNSIY